MSRQWFSVVPTTDISISDIPNVDISNIKANSSFLTESFSIY